MMKDCTKLKANSLCIVNGKFTFVQCCGKCHEKERIICYIWPKNLGSVNTNVRVLSSDCGNFDFVAAYRLHLNIKTL
jgi:hypothetical protein